MRKRKTEVFSPKKKHDSDNKKVIVIIELIVLTVLVVFIMVYKEERVIKTIDMSKPSPMITISKTEAEEPETKEEAAKVKEEKAKAKKTAPKKEKRAAAKKAKKKGSYLQLGAFAMKENYERLKDKVEKLGYPTDTKTIQKKVSTFKVTLGRFGGGESAKDAFEEVKSMGLDPKLTDLGGGKYEVSISTIFYKSDVDETINKLAKNNLKGILKEVTETSDVFVLRVGPYKTVEKAQKVKKELMKKGFGEPYLFSQ